MRWFFNSYAEANAFRNGEARYNESSMIGYDEQGKMWYCEIFGRRNSKLYHGVGIA